MSCTFTHGDTSTNSHMEAVLSGDGPAHSTAWRGPGRGGMDSRLTDSLSGSSISSTSVHACTQPTGCGPPKNAEVMRRTLLLNDWVDGAEDWSFPTCPWLQPTHPSKLEDSRFKSQIVMPPLPLPILYPSPDCCSSVHPLRVKYVWTGSVTTPADPLGCQILCSAAVLWQSVQLHAGSAAGGFRGTHHHTQVPWQRKEEFWVSFTDRCPLLPNGGHRPFTNCLIAPLLSRVQTALKASERDAVLFLVLLLPLLMSGFIASSPMMLFFMVLCFTPLHWFSVRTTTDGVSYWLLKRAARMRVSCRAEERSSTTRSCRVWQDCSSPPFCHTSLCSGDRAQNDTQPHCCIKTATSARNAHIQFSLVNMFRNFTFIVNTNKIFTLWIMKIDLIN